MIKGMSHPVIKEDIKSIVNSLGDLTRKLEGKTALITGGAGFLGRYLVLTIDYLNRHLLGKPCKMIIIDNFITGIESSLEEDENTRIMKHDLSKPFTIEEDVHYIFHAASIAAPLMYKKFPMETIDVGFLGTKNILEVAKQKKVESFLFFSTSEVYGNPPAEHIPTPETYFGNVSCFGPRAAYDEPKRIGETLCMTYADLYNLPIKIVRPFNVYGPGMRLDDGRGAINFAVSAIKGVKIPVYGDGRNTRTWTYITDATVAFFQVLLSEHNREIYNVGSDEQEIEMGHLAQLVAGLVKNENVEIHNVEGPNEAYSKADVSRRCPDLTKIRTALGYNPKVNLIMGLKRFIQWVDDALKEQNAPFGLQTKCRICENLDLKQVISLGKTPLANSLLSQSDLSKQEEVFPLEMMYCDSCKLCQLSYVVSPEKMFLDYLYVSSTTETFRKHFESFAETITNKLELKPSSLVVDIGSNDGILLKPLKNKGIRVVGIDPAENICSIARANGIDTLSGFFNEGIVEDIIRMKGRADVITANNTFAHINDIKSVVRNVKSLLKDNGAFIIEVQYLLDTIQKLTFDNIYHEHLSYFSVLSLSNFFQKHGMEIFKVEHIDTHGGSVRVYVQKIFGKNLKDSSVNNFIDRERQFGLDRYETYQQFAREIQKVRDKFREFMIRAKSEGKKIVGYGAPAKATTLLNFYDINNSHIDFIIEDNPLKQGKIVPGVRIPIKSKEALRENNPDYVTIFAWNFAEEIMRNNENLKSNGAKFVVPSPELKII